MGELLKKLTGSKWGVSGIFAALAALVATGVVAHDGTEIQGLAVGGAAVAGAGLGVAAQMLLARFGAKKDEPKP